MKQLRPLRPKYGILKVEGGVRMKTLSIIVPSYNSQDYLHHCIDSLLPGGEAVEILIVNDGSTDQTGHIAERYQAYHPEIVRVIHQENGGHGAAVAAGINHAIGSFVKVVDSDDWVDQVAYARVLDALAQFAATEQPDMVITNFVYEKEGKKNKKVMRYINALPTNRVFTWEESGRFRKGQYMLMHSLIYRTGLLRHSGLKLPRHTFYVDNLFAYIPMKDVKTMFYLDVDFYRYYIGRAGQSVQEETMIRRIDQQLRVNNIMLDGLNLDLVTDERQRVYLFNYLEIVTIVSTALLIRSGTKENLAKKSDLWRSIRTKNRPLFNKLRYGFMGHVVNLPGTIGRWISVSAYRVAQKVVGFN